MGQDYGMGRRAHFPLVMIGTVILAWTPVRAQQGLPDTPAAFETLRLSAELARMGRDTGDALALVAAARLRQEQGLRFDPDQAEHRPDAIDLWLNEAEELAGGDPHILALAQGVRDTSVKGREGGPRVSLRRLEAGGSHRSLEVFEPGRTAVVYIEGDGDTALGLVVRSGERIACEGRGRGDIKMCVWTAAAGDHYEVVVRNDGIVDNQYALATN